MISFRLLSTTYFSCCALVLTLFSNFIVAGVSYANSQLVTFQPVVLTGDQVPGADPGVTFTSFDRPVLNTHGQAAFRATLAGSGIDDTNNRALLSGAENKLGVIARTGDPAPEFGVDAKYRFMGELVVNDIGQAAFTATVSGTDLDFSNDSGILLKEGDLTRLVARAGNPAPGVGADHNFLSLGGLSMNNLGQIAFIADVGRSLVNDPSEKGIYVASAETTRLVAVTGGVAPGSGPGTTFAHFENFAFNDLGQTSFPSILQGIGITQDNNDVIYSESGGSLRLISRQGSHAPGTEPATNFRDLVWFENAINNAGDTAFHSRVIGPEVDSTKEEGIFLDTGGTLRLVARTGFNVPGTDPGVNFMYILAPLLNNAGDVAFGAALAGPGVDSTNDTVLFSTFDGFLQLIARKGDTVPGADPGTRFSELDVNSLRINDVGQTLFSGRLEGVNVDNSNDQALFATDHSGTTHLVVREGDAIDVNADPLLTEERTIQFFELSRLPSTRASPFNNAGQVALRLSFTDGTAGIFVATIGVPEPASVSLLVFVSFAHVVGRRRTPLRA